jgi:hypothetical protein
MTPHFILMIRAVRILFLPVNLQRDVGFGIPLVGTSQTPRHMTGLITAGLEHYVRVISHVH